jgi:hypothetical protein
MAEEKEPSPSTSAPNPHQPTQHSTQVFSNKNVTPSLQDGSEYSGSSYVTSRLTDSEEDYDAEQDQISLGNGYIQCHTAREAAGSVEVHEISRLPSLPSVPVRNTGQPLL